MHQKKTFHFSLFTFHLTNGFTLVELLIVITVIGILSIGGLGSFRASQINSRNAKRTADLESIRQALELYKVDNGVYPGDYITCDSSVGNFLSATCTDQETLVPKNPPDWVSVPGTLRSSLVSTYITKLPVDPTNDGTHYYFYEPVCNESTAGVCGNTLDCTGKGCCGYELGASRLEVTSGTEPKHEVCNP